MSLYTFIKHLHIILIIIIIEQAPFQGSHLGGTPCKGKTPVVIVEEIMNGAGLIEVFKVGQLPYMNNIDNNVRLMRDNDPEHTSKRVGTWLESNDINWWHTPPESLDINPKENLWLELKEYLRRVVKPKTKQELVSGILEFWETVDINKCRKCIGHFRKVIPKIIEQVVAQLFILNIMFKCTCKYYKV